MRRDKAGKGGPSSAEAAYRRFLEQQKEGLQRWAKKRAAQLDEVGMSAEMEVLVIDLLEELREEPAALAATSSVHAGTEALLLRACIELKFVERHARQAIAIVLAREGEGVEGGASLLSRPGLLSECLDWLCVHVPLDELPLQFRPKLRLTKPKPPRLGAAVGGGDGALSGGGRGSVTSVGYSDSRSAFGGGAPPPRPPPPWSCAACTFDNAAGAARCEVCGASRPLPPPPTAAEVAAAAAEQARWEAAEAEAAVARGTLRRLCAFGFAKSRCEAALGGGKGGASEEQALATLLRETLEKVAAGGSASGAAGTTTATAAGRMAAAVAAAVRGEASQRLSRLLLPTCEGEAGAAAAAEAEAAALAEAAAEEEAAALAEAAAEEEAALEAILGDYH